MACVVDFTEKQIAPPKSWERFEDLCQALFRQVWADPLAHKNGRGGQPQHGVDIYGSLDPSGGVIHGVQCKGKDANFGAKATVRELRVELAKADKFTPPLQKWIFATTAPVDVALLEESRLLSRERAKRGRFPVDVLGWGDIQSLMASYPDVLMQFYPEHGVDMAIIARVLKTAASNIAAVNDLLALAAANSAAALRKAASATWLPVKFEPQRDLKPALMGRHLGPADAVSCPILSEAKTLIEELGRGYFARLVGEAGAGKSICAFQATYHFATQGWRVMMLADPSVSQIDLYNDPSLRILYLIDDAHLVAPWALARAESQATSNTLLLTTHNAVEQSAARHGSIILDAKRAVRTIATELRKTLADTVRMVKEVDDRVSDRPFDESIEWRLDQAEFGATVPWQFCFILGGGWRRAKNLITGARVAGADIVLSIAGVRQIASRDARCDRDAFSALIDGLPLPAFDLDRATDWLVAQRLLISKDDLRTPHQRFAAVALLETLRGQTEAGQIGIWRACRRLLEDPALPLAGLLTLLNELHFNNTVDWHSRVQRDWLGPMEGRCWAASDADLPIAISGLTEIKSRQTGWSRTLSAEQRSMIVGWLSRPNNQIGYALSRLLNALRSDDEIVARNLMRQADPVSAATTYSEASPKSAFYLGSYLSVAWQLVPDPWKSKFLDTLDTAPMLRMAENWPADEPLSSFSEYCEATYWANPKLGLAIVERIIPHVILAIEQDPAATFHEILDVAWHVLKGVDLLGIYAKKFRQTAREADICRTISKRLSASLVGERLSRITKRQFQPAATLLDFLWRADRETFTKVVRAIDWQAIDATIGEDWENLFHDGEVFLRIASRDKEIALKIASMIEDRLKHAKILQPRLAIISPALIERHLDRKGILSIERNGHIDWVSGAIVVLLLAEPRPDLVPSVLEPLVSPVAEKLSDSHPSFWRDAHLFFHAIHQFGPVFFSRMLDGVNPATAEPNWIAGIKSSPDIRRATALLIKAAAPREDGLGEMARRIRKKYPSKSKPTAEDIKEFTLGNKDCSES
jgi:hypothetical protein